MTGSADNLSGKPFRRVPIWSRDTMCPGDLESFYFVLIKPDEKTKAMVYYKEAESEDYYTDFWRFPLGLVLTFLALKKRNDGFHIYLKDDDGPYIHEYDESYLGRTLSIMPPHDGFGIHKWGWHNGKTIMIYDDLEYKNVPIYEYFVSNEFPPYVALCIHKGAWSLIFIL